MSQCACSGRRNVIATNHRIAVELFFASDRIYVLQVHDSAAVKPFLAQKLTEPECVFEEFHIQSFVRLLLN